MAVINLKKIVSVYKIDNSRYEQIINESIEKRIKYSMKSTDRNFFYKRAFELIKSYNCIYNAGNKYNIEYFNFTNNTEKQLFINNFVFNDNEKFVNILKTYDITNEQIELLAEEIISAKRKAKVTNNYNFDTSKILNLDLLFNHYNISSKEIIVAKMLEIYYLQNDLLNQKVKKYQ